MDRATLRQLVGAASLLAALAHGGLAPAHFSLWWAYGAFFSVAATAQAIFALALLLDAVPRPRDRRALYALGAAGNLVLIGIYLWSRTVGVPLGPEAGAPEAVGSIDLVTKLLEAGVVVGSVLLHRRDVRTEQPAAA